MSPLKVQYVVGIGVALLLTLLLWGGSFLVWTSFLRKNLEKLGLEYHWLRGRIQFPRTNASYIQIGFLQVFVHGVGSWLSACLLSYQIMAHLWHWFLSDDELKNARDRLLHEDLSPEDARTCLFRIHEDLHLGPDVQWLKDEKPMKTSNNWFFFKKRQEANSKQNSEAWTKSA